MITTVEYTNSVSCSTLTLVRKVDESDKFDFITTLSPDNWTVSASANNLPKITGEGYASGHVQTGVPYKLAEAGDHPSYVHDGEWVCKEVTAVDADGKPRELGNSVAVSDARISVPAGKHVQCAITNATAELTVLKEVPDDLEPKATFVESDFTLDIDPGANDYGLTPTAGIVGSNTATGENSIAVRSGHKYRITEQSNDEKLAYVNVRVEKLNDDGSWSEIDPTAVAVEAGEHLTIRFVNVPPGSVPLPLTGAFGNPATMIASAAVLAVIAAAAWYVMRRKRVTPAATTLLDD